MITPAQKEQIISSIDIVDVVQDYVKLTRRGQSYLGLCPFHREKTPSFNVTPDKGIFKCFGCGKAGDAITFVREMEQVGFADALRILAKRAGIALDEQPESPEAEAASREREALLTLLTWAQDWFAKELLEGDEGRRIGLTYFRERGVGDEALAAFHLGYCPEGPDSFSNAAVKAGYRPEQLMEVGLSTSRDDRLIDRYRGRVIFPIQSATGRCIGFGARTLRSDPKIAKYVNSPESGIYRKSETLYGLAQARKAIRETSRILLVEGYLDVISLWQSGWRHVAASSGTSLTLEQAKLMHRYADSVTILYDGDSAGIKATLRAIDILLAEGMAVRVLLLPDQQDPDSFARAHSLEEIEAYAREHEEDFIQFQRRVLIPADRADDPEMRVQLLRASARSVGLISDVSRQSVYLQELSELHKITLEAAASIVRTQGDIARRELREPRLARDSSSPPAVPITPGGSAAPAQAGTITPGLTPEQALKASEQALMGSIIRYGNLPYLNPGDSESGRSFRERCASALEEHEAPLSELARATLELLATTPTTTPYDAISSLCKGQEDSDVMIQYIEDCLKVVKKVETSRRWDLDKGKSPTPPEEEGGLRPNAGVAILAKAIARLEAMMRKDDGSELSLTALHSYLYLLHLFRYNLLTQQHSERTQLLDESQLPLIGDEELERLKEAQGREKALFTRFHDKQVALFIRIIMPLR